MTNLSEPLRDMWKEVYILFDKHYKMNTHSADDWQAFWADAVPIWEKYQKMGKLAQLLSHVGELIEECHDNGY